MTAMESVGGFDKDEDFFEEDEPLEKVLAAFEGGEKFVTGRPAPVAESSPSRLGPHGSRQRTPGVRH